jgi:uncharacterized delta-60 repeat protein
MLQFNIKEFLIASQKCWRITIVLLLVAAFLSLTLPILATNSGDLDPTFGNGGVITSALPISPFLANTIAIQSNGKIVTAGHDPSANGLFAILRHNSDGSLDNSFGNGGVATSTLSNVFNTSGPVGLVLQTNGKIVIVGTKHISSTLEAIVLARYTIAGSLDSTFGSGGVVTTTIPHRSSVFFIANAIQTDGKIIVAGSSEQGDHEDFTLARYTINGALDSMFGNSGIVTTSVVGAKTRGYDVVLQSDGKIVVAGSLDASGSIAFALARYSITGTLDSSFGQGGVVTTSIDSSAELDAVVIQPDDKIIAVGSSTTGSIYTFALARYNTNGGLDNSFGSSGIVTTTINGYGDGNNIALLPDGKIIAVGSGKTDTNLSTFALARYHDDGNLDNDFGNGGIVAVPISNGETAWNLAIQPDCNKMVLVGGGIANGYTLARYLGDVQACHSYLPTLLKN